MAPARAGEARAGGARGTGVVRVGPSRHHGAHPDALIGTQPPTGLMRPATHSARVFGRSASGIGPRSRKACRWKVESPHLWAALRRASSRRLRPRQASKMLRRRSGVRRSELGLETVQGGRWGAVVRQGGGPFQPSWPRRVELRAVDAARRAAHLTVAGGGGAPSWEAAEPTASVRGCALRCVGTSGLSRSAGGAAWERAVWPVVPAGRRPCRRGAGGAASSDLVEGGDLFPSWRHQAHPLLRHRAEPLGAREHVGRHLAPRVELHPLAARRPAQPSVLHGRGVEGPHLAHAARLEHQVGGALGVDVGHDRPRRELLEPELDARHVHVHLVSAQRHHGVGPLLHPPSLACRCVGEEGDDLGRRGHGEPLPRHHAVHHVQLACEATSRKGWRPAVRACMPEASSCEASRGRPHEATSAAGRREEAHS